MLHGNAQSLVSMATLEPVKLTIKINHHRWTQWLPMVRGWELWLGIKGLGLVEVSYLSLAKGLPAEKGNRILQNFSQPRLLLTHPIP